MTSRTSKRRFTIIGGDFKAQMSRNFKDIDDKYSYSNRWNRNGKMLTEWIVKHGYEAGRFRLKIGGKDKRKHKDNSVVKSKIGFFLTNKLPLVTSFKLVKKISDGVHGGVNFDHQAIGENFLSTPSHKTSSHQDRPDFTLLLKDLNIVDLVSSKIEHELVGTPGDGDTHEALVTLAAKDQKENTPPSYLQISQHENSEAYVALVNKKEGHFATATFKKKKQLAKDVEEVAVCSKKPG
eukprot:snap_masked-scaffold_2-processed-gene-25.22-mRNA-1 protein AED:1.00 eAED:1.00 QI:0/0/0/0/1/1/2/0/236